MPPQPGLLAGFATGLLCLKTYVENVHAIPVDVIDLSYATPESCAERLERVAWTTKGRSVFGITTTTASYRAALAVAAVLKASLGDDAIIVLGGHHASADPVTILNHHGGIVDFVICGEGEVALATLLERWPEIESVPGLAWVSPDGRVVTNPAAPLLAQDVLDTLILDPTWFLDGHEAGKFDRFTYVSARGCPLRCKFCSVANQAIRGKSATIIAREITEIVAAGYDRIAIEDNFFAHSPSRTREVCEALTKLRAHGLNFKWDCQTRVEAVARPGVPKQLADAGCDEVYLGVEALTESALLFLGKALNAERYFRQLCETAIPELLGQRIHVNINIQCGLPEEAKSEPSLTLDRLAEIGKLAAARGTEITVFPQLFVIYPGTEHFREFVSEGSVWPSVFEEFTEWERSDADFIEWIGEHFAHGLGGIPLGILDRSSLRQRRFLIDWHLAVAAERLCAEMATLSGIKVFDYKSHLVRSSAIEPIERKWELVG